MIKQYQRMLTRNMPYILPQPTQSPNKNVSIRIDKSPNYNFQLNRWNNPYGFLTIPVSGITKPVIQNKLSFQTFSTAEYTYNISNNSRMQIQEIYHTPKKTEDNIQNNKQLPVQKNIFFTKSEGNNTPKQVKVGQQLQKKKVKISQLSTSKNYVKVLETNQFSNKVPSFLNRTKSPVNRYQTQTHIKKFVKPYRGSQIPRSDDYSFIDLQKNPKLNQSSKSPKKIKQIQAKMVSQKDLLQSFGPSKKFSTLLLSHNQSKMGIKKNISKQIRFSVTPNQLNQSQKINKNFDKTIKPTFVPSKKSINRFNLIKLIGSSRYSQAYLCSDKKTNTLYCLKKINKLLIKQTSDHINKIIRKIGIQFTSNHPNIIQIYDVFADSQFVYLVEQYMEGGNLSQYMKNQFTKNQHHKNIEFQNKSQTKITQKLFHINSALSYIHNNQNQKRTKVDRGAPKIHGDLRPETILMNYGVCKISPINPIKIQKATSLLHPYVCPQALAENMLSHKSDMWNLGLFLYYLCTKKSLFKVRQFDFQLSLTDQIINMDYDKQISNLKNITYSLKQILKLLLKVRPVQRASSDDVMGCTAIKMYELQQIQLNKTRFEDFQLQKRFKQQLKVDSLSLIKRSNSPISPTKFNNASYNKKPQIFL